MEYLMTYGWSILIIAVAIVALFGLGIFNVTPGSNTNACVAVSGWECTTPVLYSSGALSLNVGEIGPPITVTGVGCSSNSTEPTYFQAVSSTISSGQAASLTTACTLPSAALGSSFNGQVWIQYYYNSNPSATYSIVVANLKAYVTATGVPGQTAYVPITIYGNPAAGTSPNFQQMISFNPTQSAAYTANEASDLGNIRFFQGSTELDSWCESGCNSITSTSAVFWVKLPMGIGADANVVVNMVFLSNTVEYDGVYAGEAPQLTCTNPANPTTGCAAGQYGEYDNGASIFNNYWNFAGAGSNPPTGWSKYGSPTVAVHNGIVVSTGGWVSVYYSASAVNPQANVIELYGYTSVNEAMPLEACPTSSAAPGGTGCIEWHYTSGASANYFLQPDNNAYATSGTAAGNTNPYVFSLYETSTTLYGTINYANQLSATTGLTAETAVYLAMASKGGSTYAQWVRTRYLPPSGTMLTATFGTLSH
jgi:hypothetical protein